MNGLGKHQLKLEITLNESWKPDLSTHDLVVAHVLAQLEHLGDVKITVLNPDTGLPDSTMNV